MEVKKVCIVGAGTMGRQLAQLAAQSGYEVSMRDIEDRIVQDALAAIKASLKRFFVDKGKMTQEEADKVLGRIKGTIDLKESVKGAQVVIECVPEEMEYKQKVFKEMDEVCAPETILASNTSALSITAIGSLTKRQDRVIGMHFFNPVGVLKLVEIIRGAKTSDEAYDVIKELSDKFDKEAIAVNDAPGFVAVRLFCVLTNEAAKIVYEGIASVEDVDRACQLGLGHAMGPLKSQDVTDGVGISLHVLDYMRAELGDDYRACPLIRKKVLAGELGVKTGKGFYDYTKK